MYLDQILVSFFDQYFGQYTHTNFYSKMEITLSLPLLPNSTGGIYELGILYFKSKSIISFIKLFKFPEKYLSEIGY